MRGRVCASIKRETGLANGLSKYAVILINDACE